MCNVIIVGTALLAWLLSEGLTNQYLGNSHRNDFREKEDASIKVRKILFHPKRLKDLFVSIVVGIISFPSIMVVIVMTITMLTEIGGNKKEYLNPDWLKLLVIVLKEYLCPALTLIAVIAAIIFIINVAMFGLMKIRISFKEAIISLRRFLEIIALWVLNKSIYVPLQKIEEAHSINKKLLRSINHAYWSHGALGTTGYAFLLALLLTIICVLTCILYDNYYLSEADKSYKIKKKPNSLVLGILFIMCFIAVLYLYATGKILPINF